MSVRSFLDPCIESLLEEKPGVLVLESVRIDDTNLYCVRMGTTLEWCLFSFSFNFLERGALHRS